MSGTSKPTNEQKAMVDNALEEAIKTFDLIAAQKAIKTQQEYDECTQALREGERLEVELTEAGPMYAAVLAENAKALRLLRRRLEAYRGVQS